MGKGIVFNDKQEAMEYADTIREQGLVPDIISNRKTGQYFVGFATSKTKQKVEPQEQGRSTGTGIVGAISMMGKGLGDIGRSLATPSTNKRPRISQLPASRSEIPLTQSYNLENLKMSNLRGQTLSGIPKRRPSE